MKHGHNVYLNDFSEKFENGLCWVKTKWMMLGQKHCH